MANGIAPQLASCVVATEKELWPVICAAPNPANAGQTYYAQDTGNTWTADGNGNVTRNTTVVMYT